MDPAKNVGSEKRKKVKDGIERRVEAGDAAADGGGQGDFPGVDLPVGEECPDAVEGDAADVGVAGVVVDEIIPEDAAAGFGQRPHPVGQCLLEAIVRL